MVPMQDEGSRGLQPSSHSARMKYYHNQRGQLVLYSWLLAGAVMLAMGITIKIYAARLDSAKTEVEMVTANRDQWKSAAKDCSDATLKAAQEGQQRADKGARALLKAKNEGMAANEEIARLKMSKAGEGVCQAGQAVAKVREGLK